MFELVEIHVPTVRDYIGYAERHPALVGPHGDLKDVQRPWVMETCARLLDPGARIIDLGGAACELAGVLKADFAVTVVDPYDGAEGQGPNSSAPFRRKHPELSFHEGYLGPDTPLDGFDAVVSTSVVEHIPTGAHADTLAGIRKVLNPGGYSIHAIDVTLWGKGGFLEHTRALAAHWAASHGVVTEVEAICAAALADPETYCLSPQMYDRWRKGRPYARYPWRKVTSLDMVFRKL